MSLASLESTVNAAFDAGDGISPATKSEVRDAVDHALELNCCATKFSEAGSNRKSA
jgi:hypothetical protein